jgi:KRAB domain-containing zinc finger protein
VNKQEVIYEDPSNDEIEEVEDNFDSNFKEVLHETTIDATVEMTDETENLITYEIEDLEQPEFVEEYEEVEYLDTMQEDVKEIDEYEFVNKKRENDVKICEYCSPNLMFSTDFGLDYHLYSTHGIGNDPCICTTCNRQYTFQETETEEQISQIILKHSMDHADGKFHSCSQCYELFKTQKQLENHERVQHNSTKAQLKCKSCLIYFDSYAKLSEHLQKSSCKDVSEKSFQCYICNKLFNLGIAKKRHIREEHRDKAGADCPLCLRCKIPSATAFENHYRTHFVEPRFNCSFCDRSFHESDRLKTHIKRSHATNKYICFWCKRTFKDKSGISRHILSVHFHERNYKCNLCYKAFSASYNLKEHLFAVHKSASHTYTCEICSADFLYRKQFERHRQTCDGSLWKRSHLRNNSNSSLHNKSMLT